MSSQSPLHLVKSARVTRGGLVGLVAGLALGLLLGLLIGWVWWPVDWQSSQPATPVAGSLTSAASAGSQAAALALDPAVKAQIVASEADAYATVKTPAAAQQAANTITALGGSLKQSFEDAIAFYAGQPDGSTHVNNMVALASAMGIPISYAGLGASAAPAAGATPAASAGKIVGSLAVTPTAAPQSSSSGAGGWGLFIIFVTIVALLAGVFYWLWRRSQHQAAGATAGGFMDEEPAVYPVPTGAFDRTALEGTARPAAPPSPAPAATTYQPASSMARATTFGPVSVDPRQTQPVISPRPSASSDSNSFEDEEPEGDGSTAAPMSDWGTSERLASAGSPPAAASTYLAADPAAGGAAEESAEIGMAANLFKSAPPAAAEKPAVIGTAAAAAAARPIPGLRTDRYTVIDSHTFTYQVGIADFDVTCNVINPGDSRYIGEYGMGLAQRHGTLNNDLEQVVAMDAYLFDKTDEAQARTVERVLLSEYAHDNLYSLFEKEKQGPDPITAQPGTRFQLENRQLLLDCIVSDVRYDGEGIFQKLVVDMVLKRKTA